MALKLQNIAYIFLALLGLWLLLGLGVYALQKPIIFQLEKLPLDYSFQFDVPFEEHFLLTDDSLQINALYFPTSAIRRGAILYFHGNSKNLQHWGQYQSDFTSRGYDVFMVDFRGYGKSEGQPETAAYYRDAQLAYDWLREKFPAEDIVIYGRSLGSSIASQLATKVDARILILETPFDNLRHSLQLTIPSLWLPWNLKYPFANDSHLADIPYPIYIFHGTKDRVVSYRSAANLKPLLGARDRFFTIPGGGHKNLGEFELFQEMLEEVLGE